MSNFALRTITGLVGAAIFVFCILYSPFSAALILMWVSTLAFFEFQNLSKKITGNKGGIGHYLPALSLHVLTLIFIFLETTEPGSTNMTKALNLGWGLIVLSPFILMIDGFIRAKQKRIQQAALNLTGLFYITVPTVLLMLGIDQHYLILGFLWFVWSADTGAYLAGRAFGKTPLAPTISPKKTWEGWFGGLVMAVGMAFLVHWFFESQYNTHYTLKTIIGVAVVVSIFGPIGDLFESSLKREAEVKDSSNLIPGHGGFLDRFDAMFMAVPFVLAFLILKDVIFG